MNINITETSTIELKAIAYDNLVIIENAQKNINVIGQELQKRGVPLEVPTVPVKETFAA